MVKKIPSVDCCGVLMSRQQGQVLLVVVLVMVVILTIGISLASRSIMNSRQASEVDNSQRAFSAAEAGLQVARESGNDVETTEFTGSTTYTAAIKAIERDEFHLKNGSPILKDEGTDIWLSTYPSYANKWTNGRLSIYWGTNPDGCQNAALEIAILSGNTLSPTFDHYAYDPCASRAASNHFSPVPSGSYTVEGKTYYYRVELPVIHNGILARVIPIYVGTRIGVSTNAGTPLPSQGKIIESTGASGTTRRKIVVVQGNPKLPLEMFPYVLFTPQ